MKKYKPTVYPVVAAEALARQQDAIRWLMNAIDRIEILVLQKATPEEIHKHMKDAKDAYEIAVYPKESAQ